MGSSTSLANERVGPIAENTESNWASKPLSQPPSGWP